MSPRWISVLAALGCLWVGSASSAREIDLQGRDVHLEDLAALSAGETASLGRLVVARIPDGQTTLILSPARQKVLLRRRVPGRKLALLDDEDLTLRLRRDTHDTADREECVALAEPLDEGDYLDREAVVRSPCRNDAAHPHLVFDRRVHALRATAPVPAGTYLGHLFVAPGMVAGTDAELHLVFRDGPVEVTRKVRPLVAARAGQAMLVQTEDGKTVRARLALGSAAGEAQ